MDLATKQHTVLTEHIKWDVDSFDVSPDGKTIAFITNKEGVGRLRLLDTASRKESRRPDFRWYVSAFVARNARDRASIVIRSLPADVFSLDVHRAN